MNIQEIDLPKLAADIASMRELAEKEIRLVNQILFENVDPVPHHADLVLVVGNPTCLEDRIQKAVEVMQKSHAQYILVSGGVLLPKSNLTEAQGMRDFCVNAGIAEEKIIVENESRNTNQNFTLSAPLIMARNLTNPHIVAVSSASHMRRIRMNIEKHKGLFPENATFSFVASIHPSCNPSTWFLHEEARKTAASELTLIGRYIDKSHYPTFQI